MSVDAELVLERWRAVKERVDAAIEEALRRLPEADAIEAARYIAMGGKRLRAFIVVEVASALGADLEEALDAAVAVELVHAASLALDDIIDEDVVRRGSEAAWIRYGVKKTVMVSNLLIPYAQQMVSNRYGAEALRRTVKAWLDISRGEVMDAFMPLGPGGDAYLEMIRLKTGALFRLSSELGVLAARRPDLLPLASEYGETIGIVYQIADDIRDSRDPEKVMKEPSLRLFKKWAPTEEKAISVMKMFLERARELADRFLGTIDTVVKMIPDFVVSAMLGPGPATRRSPGAPG